MKNFFSKLEKREKFFFPFCICMYIKGKDKRGRNRRILMEGFEYKEV